MKPLEFQISWRELVSRLGLVVLVLLALPLAPAGGRFRNWLDAGDQAMQDGQPDLARRYYAMLVDASPESSPVVLERLFALAFAAEDYSLAQVYLYALVDQCGWTAERREQLGNIFDRTGQSDLSQALVYASLDQRGGDPAILSQVAKRQIDQQAWNELDTTLRQWLAVEPANGSALYWWGLLLAPSDPARASDVLAQAAQDPQWSERAETVRESLSAYGTMSMTEAHTRLGIALVGLEEWAFAERALQLAVEVNAVNPTALAYLGLARDQQGRDGLPSLQAALALSPNDPLLRYLEGVHMRHVGDERAAFDAFSQAYWLDQSNPALAAEAGVSLQHLSDFEGAEQWFRQAVSVAPADAQWTRLLAAFYADTGFQLDGEGLTFIEDAAASAADDPDLQISLGWAYQQVGNTEQARTILSDALAEAPQNWRGWIYLGAAFEQSGDPQAALAAYGTVVSAVGSETEYGLLAARAIERLSGSTS